MWLWFGGLAAIEHGFLRLFIRLVGESFCDMEVLDAAANRGLLHRIGVGYIFVHPTLQEHLSLRAPEIAERGEAWRSQDGG
jgi:hypothetical protein